jgi:hypothetical protein
VEEHKTVLDLRRRIEALEGDAEPITRTRLSSPDGDQPSA